jgi:hypothetical protein
MTRRSTSLTKRSTLLATAARIIRSNGNSPMSPSEIASRGVTGGLLRVPRGRTSGYLAQLLQSAMYNESAYGSRPSVVRHGRGLYRAKS